MQIINPSVDWEPCCRPSLSVHISRCWILRGEEASAFRLLFQGVPFWPQVWPRKVCLVVVSLPRGGWSREQCNSIIIESSASDRTLKGQVVQPCCNEWEHLWLHEVLRALSSLAWMPQAWGNLYQCLCRRLQGKSLLLLHDEDPPPGSSGDELCWTWVDCSDVDTVILEVFSNLNDSMVLSYTSVFRSLLWNPRNAGCWSARCLGCSVLLICLFGPKEIVDSEGSDDVTTQLTVLHLCCYFCFVNSAKQMNHFAACIANSTQPSQLCWALWGVFQQETLGLCSCDWIPSYRDSSVLHLC